MDVKNYEFHKPTLKDFIDPHHGDYVIYYSEKDNQFTTIYGDVIINLWEFFRPSQISNFKACGGASKKLLTKQWKFVEIVHI